jgi:hypothetical protein
MGRKPGAFEAASSDCPQWGQLNPFKAAVACFDFVHDCHSKPPLFAAVF